MSNRTKNRLFLIQLTPNEWRRCICQDSQLYCKAKSILSQLSDIIFTCPRAVKSFWNVIFNFDDNFSWSPGESGFWEGGHNTFEGVAQCSAISHFISRLPWKEQQIHTKPGRNLKFIQIQNNFGNPFCGDRDREKGIAKWI